MANIREKLHKSSLAVHDLSGSYLISSLNKGGYGNGNTNTSHDKHDNPRRYGADENRYSCKRSLNLSINDKEII